MFILANVVDDIDMRISHVIRAEEHLPNTPKAILLWQALDGGELPVFAHVPLLVNEKRQKLSKRRDPVALELYRDEGYLPEAMQNFLMLLGWAPSDDREIMPFKELAELWRLEDVHSSPAYFDVKKLEAFNGEYIRAMSTEEFVDRVPAVARGAARAVASRALRSRCVRIDGAARADAGHPLGRGSCAGRFLVPRGTADRPRVVGQGDEGA